MLVVISDAMVLIHLAKISLLECCCSHFAVVVPELVFSETVEVGKKKGFVDAIVIENLVNVGKISVKKVEKIEFVKKANDFNIFSGEAQAVALYWQENASLLATDDNNVRNKKDALELNIIGTPVIILTLFNSKKISREKAEDSIKLLRKIGWFNNSVLDKILLEVEKNG